MAKTMTAGGDVVVGGGEAWKIYEQRLLEKKQLNNETKS